MVPDKISSVFGLLMFVWLWGSVAYFALQGQPATVWGFIVGVATGYLIWWRRREWWKWGDLWDEYLNADDAWVKANKELHDFISGLKVGTYWTQEKTERIREIQERLTRANEEGAEVLRRTLRELKD